MRKLPLFGEQVNESQTDFYWTVKDDYEKLDIDKLIRLKEVRIAGGVDDQLGPLSGIQLVFTRGIESPLYASSTRVTPVSHQISSRDKIEVIGARVFSGGQSSYWIT